MSKPKPITYEGFLILIDDSRISKQTRSPFNLLRSSSRSFTLTAQTLFGDDLVDLGIVFFLHGQNSLMASNLGLKIPTVNMPLSYEATSSTRNRSLSKEIVTAAVASTFLGFGSLFLLLATGVYV
ncbi:hypothetical protein Cni_G05599 [Canna indica]|uniref:Dolichyl-diphosphooligosaccharide-protein glycosyltransferase subunit OST5 n=1 Tax=Canna indica TaxID=4628 RepID=A0AAQ3JVJ4_9LILI|nr:hypothetical protein Cni_G05599 [Canna indica]